MWWWHLAVDLAGVLIICMLCNFYGSGFDPPDSCGHIQELLKQYQQQEIVGTSDDNTAGRTDVLQSTKWINYVLIWLEILDLVP